MLGALKDGLRVMIQQHNVYYTLGALVKTPGEHYACIAKRWGTLEAPGENYTLLYNSRWSKSHIKNLRRARLNKSLGLARFEDALRVWEHGYGRAASHCTDLKQILELEELLANAKLNGHAVCEEQAMGSSCTVTSSSESDSGSAPKSHRNDQNIEITSAIVNACESVGVMEKNSITIEPHDVGGVVEESSVISRPREGVMEKSSRARVSKTTSVFVDFRLSQGIAEANDSNMACGGAQDAQDASIPILPLGDMMLPLPTNKYLPEHGLHPVLAGTKNENCEKSSLCEDCITYFNFFMCGVCVVSFTITI
ncbi:hypothetical protein AMTR_s00001p00272290 [Amborella trichopoda]|uniref:Uncharacterized protein n=1 Tax=Amborella trichopoda TaxID=13333 RepID=W1NM95_AMBTC|nr:hypothetical protein AMTR_s00001p00272290 [Amborella trichopoda]